MALCFLTVNAVSTPKLEDKAYNKLFDEKPDRLGKIISIILEAAKQSLKKKGMHFPPWRQADEKSSSSENDPGGVVAAAITAEEERRGHRWRLS
ncbi:hypothetical protein TorRG33x02_030550 [Trema orientale]|uniref:Uncharacterized protein n=1 Tax=Trema orientale TaxID=63057 RepID=A0A2P5FU46_TREOI|nr:hypothetical protein TorRG33x02_030550 [Trema orientale]